MLHDTLWRSWIFLALLSLASTALAQLDASGIVQAIAGAAILTLAYFKARLILGRYLGLAEAPYWYRGFNLVTALYMILLLALYLAGTG
ncbi:MAG: hypothetical protein Kow00114_16180 [Kiloniellaceae bacterium]